MFEGFVSEGSLSPVRVTHGCSTNCYVDTDLRKSVLVDCIADTGYQSLPLHKVCLE